MPKADPKVLLSAITRALSFYQDASKWKSIKENGMRQNLDWTKSAKAYLDMYQALLKNN
jgi:starch synthase